MPVKPVKTIVAEVGEHAAAAGMSPLALTLVSAAGAPGTTWLLSPYVTTAAKLAKEFGVSERTIASWKAAGMPGHGESGRKGHYPIAHCRRWLVENGIRPDALNYGNPGLADRQPTGDAFRASWRLVRAEIARAVSSAEVRFAKILKSHGGLTDEQAANLGSAVAGMMQSELSHLELDDAAIESLLAEVWQVV